MTDQSEDGDLTYYEQQLEILLSAAPDMEQFPTGQAIDFGMKLDRRRLIILADTVHRCTIDIATAIGHATSEYGWHQQGPFCDPSYEWNDVIWAAQQWYLEHMTKQQATELFQVLTGEVGCPDCGEQPQVRRRLNIPLIIQVGLRAGFPDVLSWRIELEPDDEGTERAPFDTNSPIASSFRSSLCYLLDWRFEGDRLWMHDTYSILSLGPWLPMFERFHSWWNAQGPILPEPEPEIKETVEA